MYLRCYPGAEYIMSTSVRSTYHMQSTSSEMLGRMKHKLESRLQEEKVIKTAINSKKLNMKI